MQKSLTDLIWLSRCDAEQVLFSDPVKIKVSHRANIYKSTYDNLRHSKRKKIRTYFLCHLEENTMGMTKKQFQDDI